MGASNSKSSVGGKAALHCIDSDILSLFEEAELVALQKFFKCQGKGLTKASVSDVLGSSTIAEASVQAMSGSANGGDYITLPNFVSYIGSMCRGQPQEKARSAFRLYSNGAAVESPWDVFEKLLTESLVAAARLTQSDEKHSWRTEQADAQRVAKGAFRNIGSDVDLATFKEAAASNPILVKASEVVCGVLLQHVMVKGGGMMPAPASRIALLPRAVPSGEGQRSVLSAESVAMLSAVLPKDLRSEWRMVYSSDQHGLSFNRFSSHLQGRGPAVVIVRDSDGYVFGGYISESMRSHPDFYGGAQAFLFTIAPKSMVYRSCGKNSNHCYYNAGMETLPNGFGMGGQMNHFGLFLDESFETGISRPQCSTFGSPTLSKEQHFKISYVEAWACDPEVYNEVDDGGPAGSGDELEGQKGVLKSENNADKFVADMLGKFQEHR